MFEDMVHNLRALLRLDKGKKEQPTATIFDGCTVQSTPESGERAGYDGYKGKKGSKIHIAVDTLGLLLAAHVTPANERERAQVKELAQAGQDVTQNTVEVAFVDQGYTGPVPQQAKEAGWWNAVLPGPLVSVDWGVTSRERLGPSAVCISSLLLSSCFVTLSTQSSTSFESL